MAAQVLYVKKGRKTLHESKHRAAIRETQKISSGCLGLERNNRIRGRRGNQAIGLLNRGPRGKEREIEVRRAG